MKPQSRSSTLAALRGRACQPVWQALSACITQHVSACVTACRTAASVTPDTACPSGGLPQIRKLRCIFNPPQIFTLIDIAEFGNSTKFCSISCALRAIRESKAAYRIARKLGGSVDCAVLAPILPF